LSCVERLRRREAGIRVGDWLLNPQPMVAAEFAALENSYGSCSTEGRGLLTRETCSEPCGRGAPLIKDVGQIVGRDIDPVGVPFGAVGGEAGQTCVDPWANQCDSESRATVQRSDDHESRWLFAAQDRLAQEFFLEIVARSRLRPGRRRGERIR
jgi:hypothetical protein